MNVLPPFSLAHYKCLLIKNFILMTSYIIVTGHKVVIYLHAKNIIRIELFWTCNINVYHNKVGW